ncbi:HNH endonuclease signature motif containing protein [Metabacillus halosaccharovorans]|uniref:HNH endonuclease signature motif containing protein n=1 Tax=Metabacillus halosaccharovorans TaxID=930124 RepID=UPI0029907198|nr:HNH endonuclease signature motif containing protein [Metabacillus halosaccharovorans]
MIRDNNECQNCKRIGRYRAADHVHHLKEVKEYPEYALTFDNLESLCRRCHNDVHDRLAEVNQPKFINEERW